MILRYWIFKKKSYLGYTEKNLDFHLIIPRLSYVSLRPPHCWSLSAKLFRPRRLATHGSNQPMTQNQRAWISIKCWTPQTMQLLLNLRIILHSNLGFFNNRLLKTNRDINQLIMTLWVALKKTKTSTSLSWVLLSFWCQGESSWFFSISKSWKADTKHPKRQAADSLLRTGDDWDDWDDWRLHLSLRLKKGGSI